MDFNILTALNDNIRIDREKCTGCARCVEVCVLDNLRLRLSPCRQACPLGMNCQGYIRHIAQGEVTKGAEKIRETVPFGGILGRICSRPCEAECSRIKVDGQAVAIRDLKRYLSDGEEKVWSPPLREREEKVAVVGAGPAGLTAAFLLRSNGFKVTLYDRESAPGGMMRWAVPEFRLPGEVLNRELGFIEALGVDYQGNRALGKEIELGRLQEKFGAVLIATGAHGRAWLGIAGEDDAAVIPALDFLRQTHEAKTPRFSGKVVVIGGGNAAVDAAQTAWRLGAKEVSLVSLEREGEMPAFPWSVAEALEEGIRLQNGWGPMSFRFNGRKLSGVMFKKCVGVCDSSGAFCPEYDEKTTFEIAADTVILAIGQKVETGVADSRLQGPAGMNCHPATLQTADPSVFSAGDALRGPRSIVEAMAQGREAAISIQRFLDGEDVEYGRVNPAPFEMNFEPDYSRAVKRARVASPMLPVGKRTLKSESAGVYSREEALAEAERCLNCGLPYGVRTCWFCLPCEIECPEKALQVEIPYLLR
ncbi:MAG TPA: FAD-dependent oxidoreductase [Thermodesulfobacteriota bacterium]|nr:FAD-dependent oxidoreductase [Thermodesulfobacteriota bacterium]